MSDARKQAWVDLVDAADAYRVAPDKAAAAQALSAAAKAWAAVSPGAAPSRGTAATGGVVPFGRDKGKPLADCSDKDLQWLAGALRRSLEDEAKARYRDANTRDLSAVEAEMQRRGL